MERHFMQACELYGPERGPKIMRKHGIRYARWHPRPKALRVAFVAVKTSAHWRHVLEEYYGRKDSAAACAGGCGSAAGAAE